MKNLFDWDKSKQRILKILKSDLQEEIKKKQIELFLQTLPFGINLANFELRYDSCGYPYWASHEKIKNDSFKLREISDLKFDPETFETDYLCPICKKSI
jgi:hypothetical protein